ncbi:MAG TPA: tetratricopeptide repeat protein [Phycisphaerales bacterium]|nr:tetratricopeptide repeat protein [Phycisphaerales bacterium]
MDQTQPNTGSPAPKPAWAGVWQAPALLLGGGLLVGGIVYAFATRPAPDAINEFRRAQTQMEEHRYGAALETLNKRVLPLMDRKALSTEQARGFHLMRARALYLGQKEAGVSRKENYESIVREYERAERRGATLEPADEEFLTRSLLAVGDLKEGSRRALAMLESRRESGVELLKAFIEKSLDEKRGDQTLALDLLTSLAAEPGLSDQNRLWALSRQARLMVAQGYHEDAARRILRTLPRVQDRADPTLRAEVLVTLARAYMGQDEHADALPQLDAALQSVGRAHPLAAEIETLAGECEQLAGRLEQARERYTSVVDDFERSQHRPRALLGLAEVEAAVAVEESAGTAPERALSLYEELVGLRHDEEQGERVDVDAVHASLLARFEEQYGRGEYRTALRFATLAEELHAGRATPDGNGTPGDVTLALAESRRRIAEELLGAGADGAGALRLLSEVDPTTQREARAMLVGAGESFRRYAESVVHEDAKAYADALWQAADSFDRAGETDATITTFLQFATDFPSDSRQPEAKFRLGQAYRAKGELLLAETVFRDLLIDRDGTGRAGPYADASYVPLAQTLLADGDDKNDEEAAHLLREVLTGRLGGAGTARYIDALRELGDYEAGAGRHEIAIERYEEYLERSASGGSSGEGAVDRGAESVLVRSRLGDAYRMSARGIEKALAGAMPEGDARRLRQTRDERLARAAELYDEVGRDLQGRARLSALEELCLRNSQFFRGDCLFDLKDYDAAIRQYDAAREMYPKDPASLVAMTQVVSALIERGDLRKARSINERARKFYESLPESTWDDPTLPMSRREWERWLASQAKLAAAPAAADAGEGTGPNH